MTARSNNRVAAEDAGIRLDVFLARLPEVGTRGRAKALVASGQVTVHGEPARKAGQVLQAGHEIAFTVIPQAPVDDLKGPDTEPPELPVLYEDAFIVAISKPAGMPTHPPEERDWRGHSVASVARRRFGAMPAVAGPDRPGIVHRLDRDTSGVMVLARTEEAFSFLQAQFKARTAEKEYRCIAFGESRFDSDWIEQAIGSDPKKPDRMAVVPEGRDASTYYEVVERFRGFTYFRCLPKTGRTHQIRVHMAHVGHSLVGDRVYQPRRQHQALPEGAPDPGRQCLHALRLQLQHPVSHEVIELEAPLPDDMAALLHWLREHRRS
jgi:23S rRNA pseudouridine1911/1915/1917 synthase